VAACSAIIHIGANIHHLVVAAAHSWSGGLATATATNLAGRTALVVAATLAWLRTADTAAGRQAILCATSGVEEVPVPSYAPRNPEVVLLVTRIRCFGRGRRSWRPKGAVAHVGVSWSSRWTVQGRANKVVCVAVVGELAAPIVSDGPGLALRTHALPCTTV
jgi:hypothetical protein